MLRFSRKAGTITEHEVDAEEEEEEGPPTAMPAFRFLAESMSTDIDMRWYLVLRL